MSASDSSPTPLEIVSRRVFHTPRAKVFAAFENPAHLQHWWGPDGFTNTIHEFDLRNGGAWRMTMHGPDGAKFENDKTFVEVVKPERVAFDHHGPMHAFRMTLTYASVGDGGENTELTWHMHFPDGTENAKLKVFIEAANEQNFDRLEAYLKTMPPAV